MKSDEPIDKLMDELTYLNSLRINPFLRIRISRTAPIFSESHPIPVKSIHQKMQQNNNTNDTIDIKWKYNRPTTEKSPNLSNISETNSVSFYEYRTRDEFVALSICTDVIESREGAITPSRRE